MGRCIVDMDEDKFEKIVSNILSNGIKNTPENGIVTITVDYNSKQKWLEINITDTGKGIPIEEMEHIFDRYYSGSNQSAASNGTGIGLDLTRKLVELHKGTIGVSSIVSEGTTFNIILPLHVHEFEIESIEKYITKPEKKHPVQLSEINPADFKHEKTILIIDDNPEMCDFIETILCESFNVIKEHNALESINRVITYLPDIIISDVMMPELNGFEL
jgi:hypothetical protein